MSRAKLKRRLLFGLFAARKLAQAYRRDRSKTSHLVEAATAKASRERILLDSAKNDLLALIRLVGSYFNREYRDVPWKTVSLALGAIIYFVNPFDLVPDFLPLTGLADDVAVVAFVLASIREDLERFQVWEREQALHLR